jgi:hypothetical protein
MFRSALWKSHRSPLTCDEAIGLDTIGDASSGTYEDSSRLSVDKDSVHHSK